LALTSLFLPPLGWLLALFVISYLWSLRQQPHRAKLRWAVLAAWSYLVVGLLLSQIITFITQTQQQQTIFLGPQVFGPVALGQSLVTHCSGFNHLSLIVGAFGTEPKGVATLHLRARLDSLEDIYTTTFDVTGLKDRARLDFRFPAQSDSAGKNYFFFIEAPSATAAEAITLRGVYDQPFDRYREGSTYAGQPGNWQLLAGDLAFTTRCEVGLFNLAHQTFQTLAKRFFGSSLLYWGLLTAHLGLLMLALVKLQKMTKLPKLGS
jgi:hypothetical protein